MLRARVLAAMLGNFSQDDRDHMVEKRRHHGHLPSSAARLTCSTQVTLQATLQVTLRARKGQQGGILNVALN